MRNYFKKTIITFICSVALVFAFSQFITFASFDKTAYVPVKVTAEQNGYSYYADANGGSVISADLVLIIPFEGTEFKVNAISYLAKKPPVIEDGELWILKEDWDTVFKDAVNIAPEQVQATNNVGSKRPNSTNAQLRTYDYKVGSDWGETVPLIIKEVGQIKHIEPAVEKTDLWVPTSMPNGKSSDESEEKEINPNEIIEQEQNSIQ